jgi:hypothetical protein
VLFNFLFGCLKCSTKRTKQKNGSSKWWNKRVRDNFFMPFVCVRRGEKNEQMQSCRAQLLSTTARRTSRFDSFLPSTNNNTQKKVKIKGGLCVCVCVSFVSAHLKSKNQWNKSKQLIGMEEVLFVFSNVFLVLGREIQKEAAVWERPSRVWISFKSIIISKP